MSLIKDESAEIDDLKISISEAVVIHILNNLDLHYSILPCDFESQCLGERETPNPK